LTLDDHLDNVFVLVVRDVGVICRLTGDVRDDLQVVAPRRRAREAVYGDRRPCPSVFDRDDRRLEVSQDHRVVIRGQHPLRMTDGRAKQGERKIRILWAAVVDGHCDRAVHPGERLIRRRAAIADHLVLDQIDGWLLEPGHDGALATTQVRYGHPLAVRGIGLVSSRDRLL
jgi:hypothetical protein